MPYLTWSYMADLVEGDKRLREDIVRRGETSDAHPFFTRKALEVDAMVDDALEEAGYAVPDGDVLPDPVLLKHAAGVLIGILTETFSAREAWMDGVHKRGLDYLAAVRAGTQTVSGFDTDTDSSPSGSVDGHISDTPTFDTADPNAASLSVFRPLGNPRSYRWR